ncbi:MAG: HAD hydrolase-like protein [Candidatus Moraniibacteriota bacterium]|jgi:FMN phosphatase YigB (HAD superfamily)
MKKVIIFDFNRTIYNPENKELISGAFDVLTKLYSEKNNILYLISRNEGEEKRELILEQFKIKKYFKEVLFVDKKNVQLFKRIIKEERVKTEQVYVIGDYLHEEIRYGNICGVNTIWFRNGKFRNMKEKCVEDKPNKVITNIKEIINQDCL